MNLIVDTALTNSQAFLTNLDFLMNLNNHVSSYVLVNSHHILFSKSVMKTISRSLLLAFENFAVAEVDNILLSLSGLSNF